MTRKDYDLIAGVLNRRMNHVRSMRDASAINDKEGDHREAELRHVIMNLSEAFAEENHRFDGDLFVAAATRPRFDG